MAPATTTRRDLRTGRPLWVDRRMPPIPVSPLTRDLKTDILVVGAGISGALVAETLARSHRVTIIDRRGPAKGSTAASTALVQYEIDEPLTALTGKIGRDKAVRAWQRSRIAVAALKARTAELGIAADAIPKSSLYLSGDVLDPAGLEEEGAVRRAAGLETTFLPAAAVRERYGITGRAGLLSHGNMALDPRRLTAGYLRHAADAGAKIYVPAEATEVEESAGEVRIGTRDGPVITASHVVYCTGYEVTNLWRSRRHQIVSTYALATRTQTRRLWPERVMMWEAADPYLYFRDTPDGRVICGGEDVEISDAEARDALLPEKIATIRRKLASLLPDLDTEAEYAWAGFFGTTTTGLPVIGPIPRHPRLWMVAGFGGNGITYSRIAADLISAGIAGRPAADADLYAP